MEMGSGSSGASDSLNGLKFGKKIYFEDVGNGGNTSGSSSKGLNVSMAAPAPAHPPPPPPPSQKKGKGVSSAGQQQSNQQQQQPPRCQVEGCLVDLTGAKAYYCRHKVCGMHSKSPKVVVAGIEQRFCQQCSRLGSSPLPTIIIIIIMFLGGFPNLFSFHFHFISDYLVLDYGLGLFGDGFASLFLSWVKLYCG
ncbi:uncharacterized protein A4U43_C05F10680 [Asparagus officinalis]|uniref:SBP-type domain-containing protein n=1 Tax=Asparagus officinalis TaxID=4686 RepID=A0A5P1ER02_ASPOF|nr:uncharacterized protein A4U43_C05F10680 [Asparagus officinalis]